MKSKINENQVILSTNRKTQNCSYRQDCVKFMDFSKTFLLFSRTDNLRKILIYTLKFNFGNARVYY